jgi:NTE family protein
MAISSRKKPHKRIGLVLGSGGARGIAHVIALEAFDRLGLKPVAIAGTSIGAILGALYASGMSGAAIRAHLIHDFKDRADVMTRLFEARVGRLADLWKGSINNPVLVDGEAILARFLPKPLPARFEDLAIPLHVVTADFHRLDRVVYSTGELAPAIAASMAIPGLVRPVVFDNRVLVDGGAVDPLPIRALVEEVDIILAIDVSRAAAREEGAKIPHSVEIGFRVFDLMQAALADAQAMNITTPLVRIKAPVEGFNALDFFSAKKILTASDAIIAEVEAALRG